MICEWLIQLKELRKINNYFLGGSTYTTQLKQIEICPDCKFVLMIFKMLCRNVKTLVFFRRISKMLETILCLFHLQSLMKPYWHSKLLLKAMKLIHQQLALPNTKCLPNVALVVPVTISGIINIILTIVIVCQRRNNPGTNAKYMKLSCFMLVFVL